MPVLGPRDLSLLVMLTGWDATELQNFKLQDGTTYAAIVAQFASKLAAVNNEFAGDWMTTLTYVTDQPENEYRVGSSNGMEVHTEYARADPRRAATEGHMKPLIPWDRTMAWTWDYLRKSREPQIMADFDDAIKDVRDRRRQRILRRLILNGDDSGIDKDLGSSGYSPGFATLAASTNVDFDPPDFGGTSFDSDHQHYVATAGGVFTNAIFTDVKDELREHGHEPPYEFILGPSDEATIKGLSGFTPVAEMGIKYGLTQDLATVDPADVGYGAYFIGMIDDIRIRVVRGMPQYYGFGFKSYGRNTQRNPVHVRVTKGAMAWQCIAMTDPHGGNGQIPIQNLMLFMEFGVGVGDRTNGTAQYVNSDTWADGTAT